MTIDGPNSVVLSQLAELCQLPGPIPMALLVVEGGKEGEHGT